MLLEIEFTGAGAFCRNDFEDLKCAWRVSVRGRDSRRRMPYLYSLRNDLWTTMITAEHDDVMRGHRFVRIGRGYLRWGRREGEQGTREGERERG